MRRGRRDRAQALRRRLTCAAGPWETPDWSPFDFVAVDAYRAAYNAATCREELRRHFRHGKPVVATEFGCCAYRGAADAGATGWMIIDYSTDPPSVKGDHRRDEGEQLTYLRELLEIFEREGVHTALWFSFAGYALPHRADPRYDLDLASYGVVKILENGCGREYPDMGWEPKEVFHGLAAAYADRTFHRDHGQCPLGSFPAANSYARRRSLVRRLREAAGAGVRHDDHFPGRGASG